jgi:acetyl-CoA carboxylase biotin carboxyl carrier protein
MVKKVKSKEKTAETKNNTKINNVKLDATNLDVFIEKLANIVSKYDLTEIEVDRDDNYLKVSKNRAVVQNNNAPSVSYQQAPQPVAVQVEPVVNAEQPSTATIVEDLTKNANVLLAPMVGTIYKKASPEDKDFKVVGDVVKKGDTVFLIEAMKVFSPVKAHKDGKVSVIYVETGKPVEYNQPLMKID